MQHQLTALEPLYWLWFNHGRTLSMRGFGGVGSGGRHRFGMASIKPSGLKEVRTLKRTDLRLESLLYEL